MKRCATRTGMPALGQKLRLYLSAVVAFLTCVFGINSDDLNTGSFSLVLEDFKELAPASVLNATGQPVVLEHVGNVQAFHSDKPVAINQIQRGLVVMFPAAVCNSCVQLGDDSNGFLAILSTTLFPADATLFSTKLRKFFFQEAGVLNLFAFRSRQEEFQANVDTDWRQLARSNGNSPQIAGENYIPFVAFALDCSRFDFAFDFTMLLAADQANILDTQFFFEPDAVAVSLKFNGIEAILGFKAWITQLLTSFDAAKEIHEALIQSSHSSLSATEIQFGEPWIEAAFTLKPVRLVIGVDADFVAAIGNIPHFKALVVKSAMCFKHRAKFAFLVAIRIEPELEGLSECGYNRFSHDTSFAERTVLVRGQGSFKRTLIPFNLARNNPLSRKGSAVILLRPSKP